CYCVNPLDGKFTFGLSLLEDASNVTCKCADHFYQTYSTIPSKACRRDEDTGKCSCHKSPDSNACADEVDQLNLERFAQISPKCSGTGNFEPLQCINGTCFCVDEATGRPTPDKAALYGALQTLPCFDLEKAKKVNTKESDANYLNPCEKQLRRPEALSLEFKKKGTELKNMKEVVCSPDGKYALKQCTDTVCMCVKPDTAGLADNYRLDLAKATDMECMCALQGYLSKQGTSYNNLACDPSGNFQAYQCSSEGRKCNCVDPYGAAISEEVDTQLRRPEALSLEFKKKGTELKNMKEVVCSPDGKYALKQCTDTVCMCVKPDTAGLADNYRLDLAKATDMECMCALQGYLSKQGTSYNNLACDPSGNFQAYQCSSEGRKCNCVDPYGAAISEEVDT
ncbi:unnamed protein product, partial [Medioppia subpectinata]